MDSNTSGGKEFSLKSDKKIDNEVGSNSSQITNLMNNKSKIVNFEAGDANDSHNFIDYFDNNFDHMVKKSTFGNCEDTTNSSIVSKLDDGLTKSHSETCIQPLVSTTSTPHLLHHSNTYPLNKYSSNLDASMQNQTSSDSTRKSASMSTKAPFNNNALQITGTKITGHISREVGSSVANSPIEINPYTDEVIVDPIIAKGTKLFKISSKKKQKRTFRIDVDQGRILWDSKKSGKVNIENIKELRVGDATRNYRMHCKLDSDDEDLWFTIIYVEAGKYKSLHLIAESAELFNKWVNTLKKLYEHRKDMMGGLVHLRKRHSIWLKQHWKQANKDGDSKLVFDEVSRLCRQLNLNISKSLLKQKFKEADEQKNGWLNFADFQQFVKIIKRRQELVDLFDSLSRTKENVLTLQEFKNFLKNTQKCNLTEDFYHKLYQKFCDIDHSEMNMEGFNSFLMSSDNPIFAPDHAKVYQDMSHPLNHYLINSSHNTYLLGHQLTGDSSEEGYIRVLQSGCRCVEIDCWDGPEGPIVTHGRTWTTKISFQDVITAINTYAFKASPYPLILSLEVHCSIEQQNQMANILRKTLGEKLVTSNFSDDETKLPSPEDLMFRILIKGKKLPPDASEDSFEESESATDPESDAESKDHADRHKHHKSVKPKKVAKALSDLVVYCSAVKFKGFEHNTDKPNKFIDMSSFSEKISTRLVKTDKQQFIQHNSRHLSRIYPSGYRIGSSNYEPHHQWMVGSQLVAMNWQTFDLGMQINQAMFTVNGRCGYVHKPERMRNFELPTHTKSLTQNLEIEIISAQQLPRPKDSLLKEIIDPFVEVELLVPGADIVKRRTRTITDNGFNPVWEETLTFTIDFEYLELVFLRFVVWDEDVRTNDFIALYSIPLASIQQGYRHIPLNDINGEQYLFTTLFVRSSLEPVS